MNSFKFLFFFVTMVAVFASCQEDLLYQDATKPVAEATFEKSGLSQTLLTERTRHEIQKTFSLAMKDIAIRYGLLGEAAKMKTGDTEVLLSEFLATKSDGGATYGELIARFSNDDKFSEVLSEVMEENPSLIIACRGNLGAFADENFIPSVYVKEDNFSEKALAVTGHNTGVERVIDLTDWKNSTFVAVHLSERHDLDGKPLYLPENLPVLNNYGGNQPLGSIGNGSLDNIPDPLVPSDEPTSCPEGIILNSFNVTEQNGAVLISYSLSGYPLSINDWVRITIQRLGPNGDVQNFFRSGSSPTAFIDSSLPIGHNLTFAYTISIDVIYNDPNTGEIVLCSVMNSPQTMSATITTEGARVESFVGTNISNQEIRYNWIDPTGGTATEYRLQWYNPNTNTYEVVAQQPASETNSFTYTYPPELRNEKVHMLIQYRSNNEALWRGDYYDETYGSFRNSNEAVKYYGVWLPNPLDYEVSSTGESLVHGAPEVRLLALKAAGENEEDLPEIVQHSIVFTRNCCYTPFDGGNLYDWFQNLISCIGDGTIEYFVPLDSYGEYGFTILPGWQNDLPGSYIRLYTRETDISELVLVSQTNTTEENVGTSLGAKLPDSLGGIQIGITSSKKSTTTTVYRYPSSDLFLNNFELSYFEPHLRRTGNELFGLFIENEEAASCEVLSETFE